MMKHLLCLLVGGATLLQGAAAAEAKNHRYLGKHPIGSTPKRGICHIELPHVHVYAPAKKNVLYRDHHGWNYFVGDPVAYGYDGPKTVYHGAHPIPVSELRVAMVVEEEAPVVEWCFLKGPHFHAFEPPSLAEYEVEDDVHWYVGEYPEDFAEQKVYLEINPIYAKITYERPVIVVEPPEDYVDILVTIVEVPAPVVVRTPGSRVQAGIDLVLPVPTLRVGVAPVYREVIIDRHHRHHKHYKHRKHRKHKKHKHHYH